MVVADASSVVDALIGSGARGEWGRAALLEHAPVVAPHLVDLEVASGLRRLALSRTVPERRIHEALRLRSTMSAYDAAYVALAKPWLFP